eukprot:5782776-Pleurochrysis_carterae.AAC.3
MEPESFAPALQDEPALAIHFHQIRMCQTPELCPNLPPEAANAHELAVRVCIEENDDSITATKALRQVIPGKQLGDHAAHAPAITVRMTGLWSKQVAWVEIDDTGRKSVRVR